MSEKREPGYYVVIVGHESEPRIGELRYDLVRFQPAWVLRFSNGELCKADSVAEWGPRLLPDLTLVQVAKEELRWLRELCDAARNENHERLCDALDRLDSLRRREGESDGS